MEDVQCEIKDIMLSLQRFSATNKSNVIFIGGLLAFDKKGNVKDKSGAIFAYGNKEKLRSLLFDVNNIMEDNADKNGFVDV